jgi:hypothetical protein
MLPEVLQKEIYEYDNSFHIFRKEEFKKELKEKFVEKWLRYIMNDYIEKKIKSGSLWENEYVYMSSYMFIKDKVCIKSMKEMDIVVDRIGEGLYFKILPKILPKGCNGKWLKYDGLLCEKELLKEEYGDKLKKAPTKIIIFIKSVMNVYMWV